MEKPVTMGNSRSLYRLFANTCPRKLSLLKITEESDEIRIHCQGRRLDCWAEHFMKQFRWPMATVDRTLVSASGPMLVNPNPPSELEAIMEVGFLKAGPDGLSRFLFKDGAKCKHQS